MSHLRPALVLLVLFTALTGILYPLAVTQIAQAAFPTAAGGSLVTDPSGRVVGSALIGQEFASPRYLHGRPSATSTPYNAAASSGSNLGPTSQALSDRIAESIAALRAEGVTGAIPADAVTASGSGLDPHVSPAFALTQVARIATARGLPEPDVRRVVEAALEGRTFGLIGEPRVNVLAVNLALDALPGQAPAAVPEARAATPVAATEEAAPVVAVPTQPAAPSGAQSPTEAAAASTPGDTPVAQ